MNIKNKQNPKTKNLLKITLSLFIFSLISVFGLSLITGNQQQSNIGTSLASAQEPADINSDNVVDIVDLSILLSNWNTTDTLSDINSDSIVDIVDLSILLSKWGAVDVSQIRSCPAYPLLPDEACTGVPDGVILEPMDGYNVTTAGTVIDGKDITGTLNIDAPNVFIRNSKITATSWYGINVRENGSLLIEDSEIIGSLAAGLNGANWTARRVRTHSGTGDNIKMGSNTTLEDSIIFGLIPAEGAHADIIQISGSSTNITIRHNVLNAYNPVIPSYGVSAIMIKTDFGTGSQGPLLIKENYLNGGSYTLYARQVNGAYIANISVLNNIFGTDYQYGSTSIDVPVIWSGNTRAGQAFDL